MSLRQWDDLYNILICGIIDSTLNSYTRMLYRFIDYYYHLNSAYRLIFYI